jgi:hypothetical protein
LNLYDYGAVYQVTVLGLTSGAQSAIASTVEATIASGGTQYRPVQLYNRSSTAAYIAFSAEL